MLGITGMAGLAALTNIAAGAQTQTVQKRPRIACLVTFWGTPGSHADWIITKLMDGYWWQGSHTPSRGDVVSVYIHQFDTSELGQKICKSKGIPIFNTVGEAVTLGGQELAVDGVVIVGEHGIIQPILKGTGFCLAGGYISRFIRVFEKSNRSVPVFNDKHLSYNWDDAKWMFDKSRELGFPLTEAPQYHSTSASRDRATCRTPIKNSIVVAVLQMREPYFIVLMYSRPSQTVARGGETGCEICAVHRGPETSKWLTAIHGQGNCLIQWRKVLTLNKESFRRTPGKTSVL
jgi:hypothetical protein